ncbi:MAG: hypothetical protein IPK16_24950 [Anaerolineales bacterium]|nr:hypothetical protein [Anaerolineales bacterium]
MEIKAIHAAASGWFAAQGLVDEAVVHALKAGDVTGAAGLVEAQVHTALDRENWRQLEHLVGLLPAEVSGRPRLLLVHAWLHFIRWQFGAVEVWLDAAEHALRSGSPAAPGMEGILWGEINILRASLANNRGDGELVVQHAEAALTMLRPELRYTMGMAQLYYIWGLQACGRYESAVDFAHRQLDMYGWQANALSLRLLLALSTVQFDMADLPGMQRTVTVWHKLAEQAGYGLSLAWSLFGFGWLCYQRNELERANEYFHRLARIAWTAHGRAVVDGYTGLVLIALARGLPDEALVQIGALNGFLLERGMSALGSVVQSLEQRVALVAGTEAALAWRQAPGTARANGDFWEQPVLTEVRTLLAAGGSPELAQANVLLAASRAEAQARNSQRRLVEIDALQALVAAAQGDKAAARATLKRSVLRAAPGGAIAVAGRLWAGIDCVLARIAGGRRRAGVYPESTGGVWRDRRDSKGVHRPGCRHGAAGKAGDAG